MNILISQDLGCAYRLQDNILEFAPMMKDGTFSTDEFNPVEPELVGEERVIFESVETDLYGVYATVTKRLAGGNTCIGWKQYYKGYYIETVVGGYVVLGEDSDLGFFDKYDDAESFIDKQDNVNEFEV
jgi:hypothetical protein